MLRPGLAAIAVPLLLILAGGCRQAANIPTPPRGVAPAPNKVRDRLTVFAGAASKPALEALGRTYQDQHGIAVDVTFGGSGSVLTQFSQEHYGDVYVPGSDDFMDKAEAKDAVLKDTRTALVYLVPTLCVAKGNPKDIKGLADLSRRDLRVVVGEPKSVCLGAIAQKTLQAEGTWDQVAPRVASYATSCENVLQELLLGEADVIIGWDVFARQQPEKVEAIALPAKYSRPRNIPAAVIKWSPKAEAAKAFIEFLAGPEARPVWQQHGYTLAPPGGAAPPGS
jgi:molybdate transport system substrate-binding protein